MHGNRDFLLGERFCSRAGGRLLPDPTRIDLYGTSTLLMHGDTLCTDDVEYQHFRATVREPRWQANFLARPLAERKAIAQGLRNRSEEAKQDKSMDIMDVALPAVEATLRRHGYPRLIHGHTHRPATHRHMVDGHECERWVLPDWYGQHGGYIEVTPRGIEARALDG
jgi:UDP-2,3-diacylglucosamine hydrolase